MPIPTSRSPWKDPQRKAAGVGVTMQRAPLGADRVAALERWQTVTQHRGMTGR